MLVKSVLRASNFSSLFYDVESYYVMEVFLSKFFHSTEIVAYPRGIMNSALLMQMVSYYASIYCINVIET